MGTTLVVCYSRTGTTSRIGKELATRLDADFECIGEARRREGFAGYALSALEALAKGVPTIRTSKAPYEYDLLVLGTPVWAGNIASPVRAYLHAHRAHLPRRLAFFATMGGHGAAEVLRDLTFECGADGAHTCSFTTAEVHEQRYATKLLAFARNLRASAQGPDAPTLTVPDPKDWQLDLTTDLIASKA